MDRTLFCKKFKNLLRSSPLLTPGAHNGQIALQAQL